MGLHKCPVCGTAVKVENLEGHVARVHPRDKSSISFSEEDRQGIRESARKAKPRFHLRRSTIAVALLLSLIVVGIIVGAPYLPNSTSHPGGMAFHWHPHLSVAIDGQAVTIPAQIGIDSGLWMVHSLDAYGMQPMPDMGMGGMAPTHTHDTSGTNHVESLVVRDYTIGDFFRIWGQSFDAQQVLGHPAPSGHRVWMTVDGASGPPSDSVVLRDGMQIEIVCGAA